VEAGAKPRRGEEPRLRGPETKWRPGPSRGEGRSQGCGGRKRSGGRGQAEARGGAKAAGAGNEVEAGAKPRRGEEPRLRGPETKWRRRISARAQGCFQWRAGGMENILRMRLRCIYTRQNKRGGSGAVRFRYSIPVACSLLANLCWFGAADLPTKGVRISNSKS
jgi:hypothetical protein